MSSTKYFNKLNHFCLCAGGGNLGGISQAIRGTAQLMEQGVGTMSKFQGMMG